MVSIILTSYNKGDVTAQCIESIKKSVSIDHEIIVVDNGSEPETIQCLRKINDIVLIENDKNLGFPKACNIGWKASKGDLVWFLNNDTIIPENSLERMVSLLLSDEKIGMVGPVTNTIHGIQEITVDYNDDCTDYKIICETAKKRMRDYSMQTLRVIRMCGFSMLVRRSTLDELGGLEERMGIGTFEDDDFCLRLVAHGYQLLIALDAFIHHIGNVSFIAAGGYPDNGDHNQRVVSTTFCLTVPEETMLEEELVERINAKAKRIIHAQCGVGAYGLYAQENGCFIVGLESNSKKFQLMKNHYNESIMYHPGKDFVFPYNEFDAVLMEKQSNDEETLSFIRSIKPALRKGAQILLQVPKIIAVSPKSKTQIQPDLIVYKETWSDKGCSPNYSEFPVTRFIDEMKSLGFALVNEKLEDPRMGYFNRCAFGRHSENKTDYKGKLSAFKEWTAEFIYTGI